MRSRAERRHHHKRMKQKVSRFHWIKKWFWGEESREQHIRRMAETRTPCSCHMCGNPRHHQKDKLTIQEKKALQQDWDNVMEDWENVKRDW